MFSTKVFSSQLLNRRQFVKVAGGTSLGFAALLTGCSSSSDTNTSTNNASSGTVAIEFLSVQQEKEGWPLILTSITNDYAKTHPGSTFKVNFQAQESLNQKIQLLAAQKALPVLYNSPPADLMVQLEKNGQVLDLEPVLQEHGATKYLVPAAVSIVKKLFNGKFVALPFELNMEGFWYNKQIFAQNDLKPPETWDELVQIATRLQERGIQPFAASGTQGWPLTRLIGNYLFRKLGPDALDNVQKGQAKLTDAEYVEAAQAVADLGKKGYFGKGVATLEYNPAQDLFLQGKAAIFYMGSWAIRDFTNPSVNKVGAENVGYFPFPNVTGGVGSSNQIAMNAGLTTAVNKEKYNAAVGQWLAAVAQNYGDIALKTQGAVTGFVASNPPANLPALTSLIINEISKTSQPVLWFEAAFSTKATDISQQSAAPLVTGAMSPNDFMTSIQEGMN